VNPMIDSALESLRDERGRLDVAIAALEQLQAPRVPVAPVRQVVKSGPAKAKAKPAPVAPAPGVRAKHGQYDSDVLDVLHLHKAEGIRCSQVARRIAGSGATPKEIESLVSSVWGVLKRFERDGKAAVQGGVWKLVE
jgi:hypothetical protein